MRRVPTAAICLCTCVSFATAENLEGPTKQTFEKGLAAYDAGNYEEAYGIFSSIDDEDVAAMRNVAYMRRHGQGTKRDAKGAEDLYQRAAEAGLPTAQADLGEMLMNGEAGKPNPAAAAVWLALASAAHHPVAEFELGELYETGSGIGQDFAQARKLYVDAAARGVPGARERLASLDANHPAPAAPRQNPSGNP
jgi:TPR repeat protein